MHDEIWLFGLIIANTISWASTALASINLNHAPSHEKMGKTLSLIISSITSTAILILIALEIFG